jgi:hypothetical protein
LAVSPACPFKDQAILKKSVAGADGRYMLAIEKPTKTLPSVKDVSRPPIMPKQLSSPLAKKIAAREQRRRPLPGSPEF